MIILTGGVLSKTLEWKSQRWRGTNRRGWRRFTKEIQVVPTECSNLRSVIKLAHFCDYTYWRCPQQDFGMEVPEVEGPTRDGGGLLKKFKLYQLTAPIYEAL